MTVRTISQLPAITSLTQEDLFEVSHCEDTNNKNKYSSKKIKYSSLSSEVFTEINENFAAKYGLFDNCIVVLNNRIVELGDLINNIKSGLTNTQQNVQSMTETKANNFKSTATLDSGAICPSSPSKFYNSTKLYCMNILEEGSNAGFNSTEITTKKAGQFICYGWLTGSQKIQPAQAYVALEAYISSQWVMIQLQPWIVGSNSQYMQYIGFNAPVTKNLKLRIRTGFKIENFSQSFSSRGLVMNGLSQNPNTNTANSFVGYII